VWISSRDRPKLFNNLININPIRLHQTQASKSLCQCPVPYTSVVTKLLTYQPIYPSYHRAHWFWSVFLPFFQESPLTHLITLTSVLCNFTSCSIFNGQFSIPATQRIPTITRLPPHLRQTTRECVYFQSCDKDGGHTIRSAISENPMLHAKFTARRALGWVTGTPGAPGSLPMSRLSDVGLRKVPWQ